VSGQALSPRLRRLPRATVAGREVRLATGFRARLLGLAFLDLDEAGSGLLILRCSSIHTFGMRFPLDVLFLDGDGAVLAARRDVSPRRVVSCRRASEVLEVPAGQGGEFSSPWA
jgi:uncharacterized membrane protein (UPF0127 family)